MYHKKRKEKKKKEGKKEKKNLLGKKYNCKLMDSSFLNIEIYDWVKTLNVVESNDNGRNYSRKENFKWYHVSKFKQN